MLHCEKTAYVNQLGCVLALGAVQTLLNRIRLLQESTVVFKTIFINYLSIPPIAMNGARKIPSKITQTRADALSQMPCVYLFFDVPQKNVFCI